MPLDGLRAWIGEVERKLGMRTRVFLALATIAIGGAGAAIYLALDTRDTAVSESDVQALQERLEGRVGASGTAGGASLAQLEAELKALEAEVEQLSGDRSGAARKKSADASEGTDETSSGSTGAPDAGGDGGASADSVGSTNLQDLLEQAKKQNKEAEEAE